MNWFRGSHQAQFGSLGLAKIGHTQYYYTVGNTCLQHTGKSKGTKVITSCKQWQCLEILPVLHIFHKGIFEYFNFQRVTVNVNEQTWTNLGEKYPASNLRAGVNVRNKCVSG